MLALRVLTPVALLAILLALPHIATAATLNVPTTAYPTIQAGVNAAHSGDTVLVADGTYTGDGNRDIDLIGGNIIIKSVHGAGKTIIDCSGSAAVNHRGFNLEGSGGIYTISGLTIKNGYVNFRDGHPGAAVIIGGGCTVALANCVFTDNTAESGSSAGMGGALYIDAPTTITGCTIKGNNADTGGGIYVDQYGTMTMTDCVITGNSATADGGGVYNAAFGNASYDIPHPSMTTCTVSGNMATDGGGLCDTGQLISTGCTFSANIATQNGGGVYNLFASATGNIYTNNMAQSGGGFAGNGILTNCTFSGNTASTYGGAIENYYGTTLTNCTFSSNTASSGGGAVHNKASSMTDNPLSIQFCTFRGNIVQGTGAKGGALENDGAAQLTDCILYDDTAGAGTEIGVANAGSSSTMVAYSDVRGGYAGSGNIDADPLFVNAAGGDFHLKAGSPCIGKGVVVQGVTTDLDGKTRPNPPSIGAYEYVAPASAHQWTATAIAAGPDGKTRILWDKTDGTATVWTLSADGSVASHGANYGPIAGWTARTISVGADNAARILWTNANGSMTVWTLPAGSATPSYGPVYGPYTGWTATGIATDSANATHVLWTNTNGAMTLWTLHTTGAPAYSPVYGPIAGWTAKAVATGTGSAAHVLWTNTGGAMTVWTLPATGSPSYGPVYGPLAGWTATALSVDGSGAGHVLWDNVSGSMTLWTLPATGSPSYSPVFGPYGGWSAVGLSVGASNYSHVLWDNTKGQMSPWTLSGSNGFVGAFPTYGPY